MIPSEFDEERLTEEAFDDYHDFLCTYEEEANCSCFNNPPCGCCTHPGNPMNLMETEDAWQDPVDLMTSIRQAAEEGQPS